MFSGIGYTRNVDNIEELIKSMNEDKINEGCKTTVSTRVNSRLSGMSRPNANASLSGTEYCVNLPSGCYELTLANLQLSNNNKTEKGYFCEDTNQFKYDSREETYYIKWKKTPIFGDSGVSGIPDLNYIKDSWSLVIFPVGNSGNTTEIISMMPVSDSCTIRDCNNSKPSPALIGLFSSPPPQPQPQTNVVQQPPPTINKGELAIARFVVSAFVVQVKKNPKYCETANNKNDIKKWYYYLLKNAIFVNGDFLTKLKFILQSDTCFQVLNGVTASSTAMTKAGTDADFNNIYQPQQGAGATTKILYKGYYYKIRTEGRKKFILTKKEGQVSLADAKKWLKKNKKP